MPNLANLLSSMFLQRRYPTSTEIMEKPVKFSKKALRTLKAWKNEHYKGWKDKDSTTRLNSLKVLAERLSEAYSKPLVVGISDHYHYKPFSMELYLQEGNPSIISTLHEFAHHLYGSSEKRACRWSVWLFKKVFPKSFEQLEFIPNSHMLCKKQPMTQSNQNSMEAKAIS